jgi:hypothetical protein
VLSGGIANLIVGTPETPFDVHVELLCDSSPYFDKLFDNRLATVSAASVSFPDDDPDTFAEFLNWVYTGTIFPSHLHPPLIELLRLWIQGEKFEVPELQNLVVARCQHIYDSKKSAILGLAAISYVYNNTVHDSVLRRMIVHIFAQRETNTRFSRDKSELPRAFLEDLCEFWFEKRDINHSDINLSPGFEQFYVTCPSSFRRDSLSNCVSSSDAETTFVREATPAALKSRSMKTPKSRRRLGTATSSICIGKPATVETDTEREDGISQNLGVLQDYDVRGEDIFHFPGKRGSLEEP